MYKKLIIILAVPLMFACAKGGGAEAGTAKVAVSVFPIYDIVCRLAGDEAEVVYGVPTGANPHSYEPAPSTAAQIASAGLFIGVTPYFDGWMADYLDESAQTVYLMDESSSDVDAHEAGNPHIWLSLSHALSIADSVESALIAYLPDSAAAFTRNADEFRAAIQSLWDEYTPVFDDSTLVFFELHPAWDYLADDFGMKVLGVLEEGHGEEPSLRHIKELTDSANAEGVRLLVVGLNTQSGTAETFVREIDGVLLELDTLGDPGDSARDGYLKLMRNNLELLAAELSN